MLERWDCWQIHKRPNGHNQSPYGIDNRTTMARTSIALLIELKNATPNHKNVYKSEAFCFQTSKSLSCPNAVNKHLCWHISILTLWINQGTNMSYQLFWISDCLDPFLNTSSFSLHSSLPPCLPGWQKLHVSTGGTRRKFWTQTKILSPNIRYFVAN